MTLSSDPQWCEVRTQYAATLTPPRGGKLQFMAFDLDLPHNVVTVRCILARGHTGADKFSITDEIIMKARPA